MGNIKILENIRVQYIGKKGIITKFIKEIYLLTEKEKKSQGEYLNNILKEINKKIIEKKDKIVKSELSNNISKEYIDISTPIYNTSIKGSIHPISQGMNEL